MVQETNNVNGQKIQELIFKHTSARDYDQTYNKKAPHQVAVSESDMNIREPLTSRRRVEVKMKLVATKGLIVFFRLAKVTFTHLRSEQQLSTRNFSFSTCQHVNNISWCKSFIDYC